LLPTDIRTLIPDVHVCFFIEKLVNCVDFSEIDFQYVDTPGQKAYPAAMLVRIIIMGTIYSIHSSRKLERVVRENIVFMYLAGFQTPVFSTIAAFKREHSDLIERVFLETINYGHNCNLIDFDSISIDGSKTKAYANKYNNLTNEDVLKLLHIIRKGIIIDEEENKALENRNNKTITDNEDKKE
jgi:transposase